MSTTNYTGELPGTLKLFDTPFYYSSFYNVEGYFLFDYESIKSNLDEMLYEEILPYIHDGKVLISHNFQHYTGHSNNGNVETGERGTNITNEIEFNILAFPKDLKDKVPSLSFKDILLGKDTTKTIGNYRLLVTCDNRFAVKAGIDLYSENKTVAVFNFDIPSLNTTYLPEASKSEPHFYKNNSLWKISCLDIAKMADVPNDEADDFSKWIKPKTDTILQPGAFSDFEANVEGLSGEIVNISPVTQFGKRYGKLIGCNLNILPLSNLYLLEDENSDRLKLTFTKRITMDFISELDHLVNIFINNTPITFAIRTTQSQPVAIQNGPYYII